MLVNSINTSADIIKPEILEPFPRSQARKGRKKGKSRIWTDSPENEENFREEEVKHEMENIKAIKSKFLQKKTSAQDDSSNCDDSVI